ncbi:DUF1127 domain-containing protein [Bradyrhizobium sp. USDA 4473]
MPPQQTNFTSESGRDATGLSRAIVLAKDATGDAVAEPCPDVSIAARRDAVSEKQAVGPPVAATQSVPGLLRRCWRAVRTWRQRKRLRVNLRDLSDRELMDIGLTPGEIDCIAADRALERLRDSTAHLWLSRGLM